MNLRRSLTRKLALFILLSALFSASMLSAQTDVTLKITTHGFARIKISLVNSGVSQAQELQEKVTIYGETLEEDLKISGYFTVVEDKTESTPSVVASSRLSLRGEDLTSEVHLRDNSSGQTIFKRKYCHSKDMARSLAHIVSDDIVYALTGNVGIANTRIAFVAGARRAAHLYVVNLDGTGLAKLTSVPSIVMSPDWSPDGTRLAYVSYEESKPFVYVIDVSSQKKVAFAHFEGLNASPAWSPDGSRIALTLSKDGNPEIYVMNADGSNLRRITYYTGIDCSPTWSPNGLELAFTSDRAGSPQIFAVDIQGLGVRRVTFEGSYNTSPAWSPQGDLIAYVSRIEGSFQICTVDPFGLVTTVLTHQGNNEDPEWSHDGMHIVYRSTQEGKSAIYIMNRDGSDKRMIPIDVDNPRNPDWSPPVRRSPEDIESP